jgi:hypothetical protein
MIFTKALEVRRILGDMTAEEWKVIKYQLMGVGSNKQLVISPYCPRCDFEAALSMALQIAQHEQKTKSNQLYRFPQVKKSFIFQLLKK